MLVQIYVNTLNKTDELWRAHFYRVLKEKKHI